MELAQNFEKLYTIIMEQESVCEQNHTYKVEEKESSLHLNIVENVTGNRLKTLSSVLKSYFTMENIEENCFECNSVKRLQRRAVCGPDILVLQLKRFSNVEIDDKIVIQKEDHEIYIDNQIYFADNEYVLRSFISHRGSECTSGHYTCIGICEQTGLSFCADDDKVRPISQDGMFKLLKASYVLLYERKVEELKEDLGKLVSKKEN